MKFQILFAINLIHLNMRNKYNGQEFVVIRVGRSTNRN